MLENINSLYAAFKAKDARFDGRFFVGISSTGYTAALSAKPGSRSRKIAHFLKLLLKQNKRVIDLAFYAGQSWPPVLR